MNENKSEVKGFFLYFDQWELISHLPDDQVKGVITACCDYMQGKDPDLTNPTVYCVFGLVRPTLEKSKARAIAGKKGGEANGKQNESKPEAKPKQTGSKTEANEEQTGSKNEKLPENPVSKPEANGSKPEANGSYLKSKIQDSIITTLRVVVDSDAADASTAEAASEETAVEAQKPSGPPPCPHQQIIDAYHELLPELPRIRSWTNTRSKHLAARWRERLAAGKYETAAEGIAYWRRLFEYIHGQCPWLMGQRTGRDGRAFYASLGWLVQPENFAKVIEGKYVEREGGEA